MTLMGASDSVTEVFIVKATEWTQPLCITHATKIQKHFYSYFIPVVLHWSWASFRVSVFTYGEKLKESIGMHGTSWNINCTSQHCFCLTSLDRDSCEFQRQTAAQQKRHSTVWHKFYRNNSEIPFSSVSGSFAVGEETLKHCKCNCMQK